MKRGLFWALIFEAPCKRTQHCWPTTLNIVGCYMSRPFAHPVACCCVFLGVVGSVCTPLPTRTQQLQPRLGVVAFVCTYLKATCKRIWHCSPTTPSTVGCYMSRPFAHPVACRCLLLEVVAQSLKPVTLLSTYKRTQQLPTKLRLFARGLIINQCLNSER